MKILLQTEASKKTGKPESKQKNEKKVISQMQAKTVSWNDIRPQLLDNPEVQAEYEGLEEKFKLTHQIISLRKASGLSQREFAIWSRN
jgi:DNA-binding transcriptional regulator YiaG